MIAKNLKVIRYPDDVLRQTTRNVSDVKDPAVQQLIKDMLKTMTENSGVGLAAPQVGSDLRICVIRLDNEIYVLVNPQIKSSSRSKEIIEEGCLSFPGKFIPIERPSKIKVRAIDQNGDKLKIKAIGLLARVIQHEIDHLDGILFIDRAVKASDKN